MRNPTTVLTDSTDPTTREPERHEEEPREPDLEALAASAGSGDRIALESLARAVRPSVLRWALVRLGDSDEAEDVAQVVLASLSEDIGKYGGRARFLTWLYRVTMNRIGDRTRAMKTRVRLERRQGPRLAAGGPVADRPYEPVTCPPGDRGPSRGLCWGPGGGLRRMNCAKWRRMMLTAASAELGGVVGTPLADHIRECEECGRAAERTLRVGAALSRAIG
jgi:RNA polymerase sigma factor (sigma-70 family)